MAGLDPAIHVDPRVKPGGDEKGWFKRSGIREGREAAQPASGSGSSIGASGGAPPPGMPASATLRIIETSA